MAGRRPAHRTVVDGELHDRHYGRFPFRQIGHDSPHPQAQHVAPVLGAALQVIDRLRLDGGHVGRPRDRRVVEPWPSSARSARASTDGRGADAAHGQARDAAAAAVQHEHGGQPHQRLVLLGTRRPLQISPARAGAAWRERRCLSNTSASPQGRLIEAGEELGDRHDAGAAGPVQAHAGAQGEQRRRGIGGGFAVGRDCRPGSPGSARSGSPPGCTRRRGAGCAPARAPRATPPSGW